jgi:hypothetical protein
MSPFIQTIADPAHARETLARRPYGVIETAGGELAAIHLRPWPKLFASPRRPIASGDRCWLYYNQPRSCRDYLALKYVVSTRDCTFETARAAMVALDEIARIKRSLAIVCHVANDKISHRLLIRWGWERHLLESGRRHYIKRFEVTRPPKIRASTCGIAQKETAPQTVCGAVLPNVEA